MTAPAISSALMKLNAFRRFRREPIVFAMKEKTPIDWEDLEEKPTSSKGHCPECGPDRNADVVGFHRWRWDNDETGLWGSVEYYILKCRGCESAYFKTSEYCSEDIDQRTNPITGQWEGELVETAKYWPAPSKRKRPEWIYDLTGADWGLSYLFRDIYTALDNGLNILAAMGIRTVFDKASELVGIDPAITFNEKLDELLAMGKIGQDERQTLDVLTDAGSAAAHRGWNPSPEELDTMMAIIEAFLYRTFILGEAAKKLKAGVPEKPKRKK
jgi:hypothetical protein